MTRLRAIAAAAAAAAPTALALLAPAAAHAQATASPYTSAARYDAAGRVTGTIAPDPDGAGALAFPAVRKSYDGAGRLIKVEIGELAAWQSDTVAPAAWSGFTIFRTAETSYDSNDRKIRESLRDSAGVVQTVTQYSYDVLGRLQCTAVRMNVAVFASLPSSACTLGTEGGQGPDRIIRNVYDAAGQRLQLRKGVGTEVEGAEATWAYSANGRVVTVIDGNGNRATMRYDAYDRQDRWTFPSTTRAAAYNDATQASALSSAGAVNTADFEEYGYDLNGNRVTLRRRDGRYIAFARDALNRVTAKTYPQGGATAVHYSYDLRNLQLSARFASQSGEGITNAYDGFGRLASSSTNMGGTTRTLGYTYDANGNRLSLTHPDGIWFGAWYDGLNRQYYLHANNSLGLVYTYYAPHGGPSAVGRTGIATWFGYDGVQRLATLAHTAYSPAATDVAFSYTRNPTSGIAAVTRNNDSYAWTGHYAVSRPYTTNGLNQYSAAGGASFTYDTNGNLTSDGTRTYAYDIENRLLSSSNGAALSYDPLGRLYQVTLGAGTTRFLYDGDALVAEYDAAGAMTRRHAHWAGADVPVATFDVPAGGGLGTVSHLFADQQGSIIAFGDVAGAVTAINRYDEYGIPAATNAGRFQYTGQAWLTELGMYHYKARIYSPTLGRFLQTDPVGYEGGMNIYGYVENDPVNRSDPTGLDPRTVVTDPETGARTITIPTRGLSSEALAAVQAVASEIHAPAGEREVHVRVVEARSADGDTQTVNLSPGKDWEHFRERGEGNFIEGRFIHIDSTRGDWAAAVLHDLLHGGRPRGLGFQTGPIDRYDPATSVPWRGYLYNIMGRTSGSDARELNNEQVDTEIVPVSDTLQATNHPDARDPF